MKMFCVMTVLALSSTLAQAAPLGGKVTFVAKGEGLALDITSEGGVLMGDVKKDGDLVSGTFEVKLAQLKTGIDLRDEHMQKAFESSKYPLAKFTLKPVKLGANNGPFSGEMTLHGVTKPISGTARQAGKDVTAEFKILLSDFAIKPPEYKLAKVKNEVEVKVSLSL